MDKKEFWQQLRKRYMYRSPKRRLLFSRLPVIASLGYYSGICKVIFDHSRIAGRGDYTREKWGEGSWKMMKAAEAVGGDIEISGLEDTASYNGPIVFVANHMSMVDALFLPGISLPFNDVSFVVKESLLDYPFFGHIMRAVHPIPVTRKDPRQDLKQVMKQGKARLKDGASVIVFPQATRTHFFDGALFNSLGVKLARFAGVPVVPIALKTDFQGHGKWHKDLGAVDPQKTIRIKFGPLLTIKGKGRQTHETVVRFIAAHLKEWGAIVKNVDFSKKPEGE